MSMRRGRRNLVRRTIGRLPSHHRFLPVTCNQSLFAIPVNLPQRCVTPSPSERRIDRSYSCLYTTAVESISNRSNPRNSIVQKMLKDKEKEKLEQLFEK